MHESRSPVSLRDSPLYKRILGQSLNSVGLRQDGGGIASGATLHRVPPKHDLSPVAEAASNSQSSVNITDLSNEQNARLVRGVAEVAAAAATAAVQDVQHSARKTVRPVQNMTPTLDEDMPVGAEAAEAHGGHDAPNWSRTKSSVILLCATVLYAIIAEILVNTVDVVLENFDIDEKFLGITLFALVPNTTEFLVGHNSSAH
jgi:Ca2+:H+ antiporter